jgi:hypothetical protein
MFLDSNRFHKLSRALTRSLAVFAVLSAPVVLTACSKDEPTPAPVVEDLKLRPGERRPGVNVPEVDTVFVELTLNKEALFGQEFLYGLDLQHSSLFEPAYQLTLQAFAMGHVPARFRVAGKELQLVADNKLLWKSDVNHPERVITRFQILSETATTFTVTAGRADAFLAQMFFFENTDENPLASSKGPLPKDQWVRSFQYDPNGNYLLQETSIVLGDGTIAEAMESIFPRANLASSPGFDLIEMDPDHPAGGENGLFERFRFLSGMTINRGEQGLTFAQRFDIRDSQGNIKTIDWYVTANAPEEFMGSIRAGVEGWNRYFRGLKGVERDVVRFLGRLPSTIKVGDPRYNVIVWDSRLQAGAAYESQSSDPETGKQSHSLIYLPAMWAKSGRDLWASGQFSDVRARSDDHAHARPSKPRSRAAALLSKACLRDIQDRYEHLLSARLSSPQEVENFGKQLLAGTLLHEVGHALGLAHNFKGSLSMNRADPNTAFSTTIMDYNDFEVERATFNGVNTSEGPILEYDRQILSALYNQMKDVPESAPVLPVCNDAEADNEQGGIDPLCVRYDLEKDPTFSIETARKRLQQETLERDVTASQAVGRVLPFLYPQTELDKIATKADFDKAVRALSTGIRNSMRYHTHGSRQSFFRTTTTTLRTLLVHESDSLPAGYDARQMRERVFAAVNEGLSMRKLPDGLRAKADEARVQALSALESTPYAKGLVAEELKKALEAAESAVKRAVLALEMDATVGLPAARTALFSALTRRAAVPYFLDTTTEQPQDFEAAIIGLASEAVKKASGRTDSERVAAATTLMTYRGRLGVAPAIEALHAEALVERVAARTNAERELAERLLKILKPAP